MVGKLSVTPVFETLLIEECFGSFALQHGKRGKNVGFGADGAATVTDSGELGLGQPMSANSASRSP